MEDPAHQTRLKSHFSLNRDIRAFMALVAVAFGGIIWLFQCARRQHDLVVLIRESGGQVAYDRRFPRPGK